MNSNNVNTNNKKKLEGIAKHYVVREKDLPFSCPPNDKDVWNLHPKVYLPIEETGEISCPYCGSKYVLEHDL